MNRQNGSQPPAESPSLETDSIQQLVQMIGQLERKVDQLMQRANDAHAPSLESEGQNELDPQNQPEPAGFPPNHVVPAEKEPATRLLQADSGRPFGKNHGTEEDHDTEEIEPPVVDRSTLDQADPLSEPTLSSNDVASQSPTTPWKKLDPTAGQAPDQEHCGHKSDVKDMAGFVEPPAGNGGNSEDRFAADQPAAFEPVGDKTDVAAELRPSFLPTSLPLGYDPSIQQSGQPDSEPSFVPATHSPTEDAAPDFESSDSSVRDYMQQLLQRLSGRSTKPAPPKVAAERTVKTPSTPVHRPQSGLAAQPTGPIKENDFVPRRSAPEKTAHLDVLRQVANQSAKNAIALASKRRRAGNGIAFLAAAGLLVCLSGIFFTLSSQLLDFFSLVAAALAALSVFSGFIFFSAQWPILRGVQSVGRSLPPANSAAADNPKSGEHRSD